MKKKLVYSRTRVAPRLRGRLCVHCKQLTMFDDTLVLIEQYDHHVCWDCIAHLYTPCEGCQSHFLHNDKNLKPLHDDSGKVCKSCISEQLYNYCKDCKKLFVAEECERYDHLRGCVCDECLKKNYVECDYCGLFWKSENIRHDSNNKKRCVPCADHIKECGHCHKFLPIEEARENGGRYYCTRCFSDVFSICDYCRDTFNRQEIFSYEGHIYCWDCGEVRGYPTFALMGRLLQGYGYKPKPRFHKLVGESDKFHMGLELEIEKSGSIVSREDMIKELFPIFKNFAYYKQDGSLTHGIEMVTHPFTWGWFKKNREMFSVGLKTMRDAKYTSYETGSCGIHIHISRNAFLVDSHWFKFLKFFFENHDFIFKISQRDKNKCGGCSWGAANHNHTQKQLIEKTKDKRSGQRYTAVNCTNDQTAEVRIFRGTLKESSFFKNIEFTRAVYEFSSITGIKGINVKEFIKYVNNDRKIYPNLYKFIIDKGIS